MKDYLRYLVDEGFVAIHYNYKQDGTIEGKISTLKDFEPTYIEVDSDKSDLLWKKYGKNYLYKPTPQFFKAYGKFCADHQETAFASRIWIQETKEAVAYYK